MKDSGRPTEQVVDSVQFGQEKRGFPVKKTEYSC